MKTGSYINGKWFHPRSKFLIKNINPSDIQDVISEYPEATGEDVQEAVEAAAKAFTSWKNLPAPERGRILWKAREITFKRIEDIAQMMTREEGKTIKESKGEIMRSLAVLEYYSGAGFRLSGQTLPAEQKESFIYTLRRPLGVVALITPWNFPWATPLWKIAPALVAGNTIVLKPSEYTPQMAAMLIEVFEEAGLPPGVFNVVNGRGSSIGDALILNPQVKAVSFTGSNEVGHAVYAKAATMGKKVTCEMGGKNAVIILPDADLEKAAQYITIGAFGATGQRCTATSRLIVFENQKNDILEKIIENTKKIKIGAGNQEGVDMGPAVNEDQLHKDFSYIELAKNEGAKLVYGGKKPVGLERGYFIEPTIFDHVTPEMRIFKEEVFGPVLSLVTATDIDEAIRIANGVEYGLSTALFTQDVNHVMRFIEDVETGMVHINEATIGAEAQAPFGGHKRTSIGDREMGDEGLNFFTETKTVFINYAKGTTRSFMR